MRQKMRNASPNRGGQQKLMINIEGFQILSPQRKDEDLALFHDMRTLENKNFLHPSVDDIEASLSTKLGGLTGFRVSASPSPSWKGNDLLATADSEKTDYDWLLTPPGTPLFPSLDKDSLQTYMDHSVVTRSYSASKGSKLSGSNTTELHRMSRGSPGPRTPTSTPSSTSSLLTFSRGRAPSPSRGNSSPTMRHSTPVKTLTRSTTITNKTSKRSSPPVLRRTNTSPSIRSSSTERHSPLSKGRSSISPKMQAWHAPELGFSDDPPPNLRTSLSDRPLSSSRNGTGRPRIGVQEARHHPESRHSYSEAVERRQSHWRNSSSSTSKLSSSTTSQDRWSSRGSVVSSSDDSMDVMEPTFLDFSATSPSSTSGTSRSLAGGFDNEVSSRYSPTAIRQKKGTAFGANTAGFSSVSARKSLESSMQLVDQRRVSQNMFRPLLSSAPTSSFCNGHTVTKHRPTNAFVETSITASSNASSEKGVRIFPGNESSDEESEVESKWDKSMSMPAGSAMSKFVLNNDDAIDDVYKRVHDQVDQFEQESVADNASCTLDGCKGDGRGVHANPGEWEANGDEDSQEEDKNCFISKFPLINQIVCASANKDAEYCSTPQLNADDDLVKNNQDEVQNGGSAWLYCNSVNSYKQIEHEVCDGTLNPNKLYRTEEECFQERKREVSIKQVICSAKGHRDTQNCSTAKQSQYNGKNCLTAEQSQHNGMDQMVFGTFNCNELYKTEKENFEEAKREVSIKQTIYSPKGQRDTQICFTAEQSQHEGMNQPVIESITNLSELKTMPYNENNDVRLHSHNHGQVLISNHIATSKMNTDFPERQHGTNVVLKDNSLQDMERPPIMKVLLSKNADAIDVTPSPLASIVARTLASVHLEAEDCFQSESPILVGKRSSICQELQGESSSFPPSQRTEIHSSLVYQPEIGLEGSCRKSSIDMLLVEKNTEPEGLNCHNLTTPQTQLLIEKEKDAFSEDYSGVDYKQYTQIGSVSHAINSDKDNCQLAETPSHNDIAQASLNGEAEKSHDSEALSNGSLKSMEIQNNDYCPVDLSPTCMFPGEENSFEGSSGIEGSERVELSKSDDDSASAHSQNNLQPPDNFQPESTPELTFAVTDIQESAVPSNTGGSEVGTNLATEVNSSKAEGDYHPPRGSPLKTQASPEPRAATPSFSLEEATNTILFCSSIVHDLVYKAATVAAENKAEALKASVPLVLESRAQNTNADFMRSLRGKVSKSATWKLRQKEANASSRKLPTVELPEVPLTVTKRPTPIKGMDRDPARLESDKEPPDTSKERSFMGMSLNSNCKCTVM